MSGPKRPVSARDQARLAAEQAAARRRERRILLGAVLGLVLVVVAGGIGLQAWRTSRAPSADPVPSVSLRPYSLADGRPAVFGSSSAPRVATLYSDFHCPHCADFEEQLGPTLDEAVAAGRVRLEIYPMAFIDEGSTSSANAFGCATEAGFGTEYFAGLFANPQLRWSDDQLLALPAAVGAPAIPEFERCVTGRAKTGWVDSINAAAAERGVTGTPTLFLDAAPVDVAGLTPEGLAAMINP